MLFYVFIAFLACASGDDLEPKFQVLTSDKLVVEIPHYEQKKLIDFRMDVQRAGNEDDHLEVAESDISDDKVYIHDPRLKLKKGDVVTYLLIFKRGTNYETQSGKYEFDGDFNKKPSSHRRFPRALSSFDEQQFQGDSDRIDGFNPLASRFGGGYHHHQFSGGQWSPYHEFNPFATTKKPVFASYYPQGGANNVEFYCKMCSSFGGTTKRLDTGSSVAPLIDRRILGNV